MYVATTGSDSNPGSIDKPWRTIQHAVTLANPGVTIYVRAGTYNENVRITQSGTATQRITLSGYPGEVAILDGGSPTCAGAAVQTAGAVGYWTIENLSIQAKSRNMMILGWWGGPKTHDLIIRHNHLYGSTATDGHNNQFIGNDVSGVYLDGTSYSTCSQGDAGLMDFDGSYNNLFQGNNVHDFTNVDGRGIWTQGYTHDERIIGNTITNIKPTGGIGQSIDLDGAGTVEWNQLVSGNIVDGNNYVGIQLENVFNSTIELNTVRNTGSSGIILINYDSKVGCPAIGTKSNPVGDSNGDKSCQDELSGNIIHGNLVTTSGGWGWGYGGVIDWGVRGISVLGNTIWSHSGSGNGSLNFQSAQAYNDHAIVRDNIIGSDNGLAVCSQSGFAIFDHDDHNLVYNVRTQTVYGTGSSCSGGMKLGDYQANTGLGAGSIQASPLFVTAADYHLQPGSPAIDKGIAVGSMLDIDGILRPQGSAYDIGAYEFVPAR